MQSAKSVVISLIALIALYLGYLYLNNSSIIPVVMTEQQAEVNDLFSIMHQRTVANLWDEQDERVFSEAKKVMPGIEDLRKYGFDHPDYRNRAYRGITDKQRINEISCAYCAYRILSEEIKIMSRIEIARFWKEKMGDDARVAFLALPSRMDYIYYLQLFGKGYSVVLKVDAVTGSAKGYEYIANAKAAGERKDEIQ